jgi:hypothetical protein
MDKNELAKQTKLAFEFIQKLYLETSYLIKEIEGILLEEKEKFVICRPSGYAVSVRSSTGLESTYVNLWLMRKLAVSFIPEDSTMLEKGQTHTNITRDLKILYVRIVFDDKDIKEPVINSGFLTNFEIKEPGKRWTGKFEKMMSHITYNDQRLFIEPGKVDYEDSHVKFNGRFVDNYLYDLIDSETLNKKVIEPTLKLFRAIK